MVNGEIVFTEYVPEYRGFTADEARKFNHQLQEEFEQRRQRG